MTIDQNTFLGYIKGSCIILNVGRNVEIINNKSQSGTNLPDYATKMSIPNSIKSNNINTFLLIKRSYLTNNSTIEINNNNAQDLSNEFIKFIQTDNFNTSHVNEMNITRNIIGYSKNSSSSNKYFLINSEFPITAGSSSTIENNIIQSQKGKNEPIEFYNFSIK